MIMYSCYISVLLVGQKLKSHVETLCDLTRVEWGRIWLSATEVGECYAARDTVQLGTWLDHISAGKHPQTSEQMDAECMQGTWFCWFEYENFRYNLILSRSEGWWGGQGDRCWICSVVAHLQRHLDKRMYWTWCPQSILGISSSIKVIQKRELTSEYPGH